MTVSFSNSINNGVNYPLATKANGKSTSTEIVDQPKQTKNTKHEEKVSNKLKAGVLMTTLAGVSIAMLRTFKVHGMPNKISSLWKIKYSEEAEELGEKALNPHATLPHLIKRLAMGSVGGGLLGGLMFDKSENYNAKIRESVIQLVGNIGIPIGMVLGAEAIHGKFKNNIDKFFDFKKGSLLYKIPKVGMTMGALTAGVVIGNNIGNFINKKIFKCDEKRLLKLTDLSPHLDDLATSVTFIAPKGSQISNYMARIVPAALSIAGYSVGTAQENPEKVLLIKEKKIQKAAEKLAIKQAKTEAKMASKC